MQHVGPHGDRGAVKHRVHVDGAVIAHVFAIRTLRLDIAALVQITFERHLGVGRHQNVVGETLDHRRRLAAKIGDEIEFVAGLARGGGEEIERMGADRKRHRQFLAARHACGVDALEVGWRGDVGAALIAIAQTQAAAADIAPAGRRVDHIIDRRTHIAAAVIGMLRMERQFGQIDVLAGDLDPMHRRVARRHFDERLRTGEALEIFVVKLFFGCPERCGKPLAIARRLGDELHLFGPRSLEQHRLLGALDDGAYCRQGNGLFVNVDLAERDEAVDEIAQTVLVEVDGRGGAAHGSISAN